MRLTRAEIRRRNRDALLDAAAQVFAQRGFRVATVDDVAAAAGLTKGAVYSHFDDKHDLFAAAIARRYAERHQTFLEIMSTGVGEERVAVAATEFVRSVTADADWALLFVEAWAEMMRTPTFGVELRRLANEFRTAVARLVEDQLAAQGRRAQGSAERVAEMVIAASHGFGVAHRLDPEHAPAELFAEHMALVAAGVLAASEPLSR